MSKKRAPFVEDVNRKKYNSKFEYVVKTYWRPFMAWQYFFVCIFDFILGPVGYSIMYAMGFLHGNYVPWESITLQGGGLYHISMGAIVGVTAWTRGMEQIKYGDSSYPTYDTDLREIPYPSDSIIDDDRDPVEEAEARMRP
jgi:hypothetical protein